MLSPRSRIAPSLAALTLTFALGATAPGCLDARDGAPSMGAPEPSPSLDPTDPTDPNDPNDPNDPALDPDPIPEKNAVCPSRAAAPSTPVVVLPDPVTAHALRADGTLVALPIWADAPPADVRTASAAAAYDVIVATSGWGPWSGPDGGTALAAFDHDGAPLWRRVFPGKQAMVRGVEADGATLVVVRTAGAYADGVMIRISRAGQETRATEPPNFYPFDVADDDGNLPGRLEPPDGGPAVHGWLRTDGTFTAVGGLDARWLGVFDGEIVVFEDSPYAGARLVLATATTSRVAWLGAAASAMAAPRAAHPNGGWLLLYDQNRWGWEVPPLDDPAAFAPATLLRVRLETLAVEELTVALPSAQRPLGCYSEAWHVDARGRLLTVAHDASGARVQRYDVDAAAWTPLGPPLSQVENVTLTVRGETALVGVMGHGTTYCPRLDWEEPPAGAHVGSGTILIGPDDVATILDDLAWTTHGLSDDGLCAARWHHDADTAHIEVIDTPTRARVSVESAYWPLWLL